MLAEKPSVVGVSTGWPSASKNAACPSGVGGAVTSVTATGPASITRLVPAVSSTQVVAPSVQ